MKDQRRIINILLADNDSNACLQFERAFQQIEWNYDLFCVKDGIQLLQYLRKLGGYTAPTFTPRPDLILLNLDIPHLDGRKALAEIKSDPDLRSIPVVVLSNTSSQEDILLTYYLGGAGFIIMPATFDGVVEVVKGLHEYWFEVVELASGELMKNGINGNTERSSSG
jgi:CheY-like chemotaxis protein